MLSVEEARARLLAAAQPVAASEPVPVAQALGRVLAQPVASPIAVPSLPTSQMDGYALRAADLPTVPATLPVA